MMFKHFLFVSFLSLACGVTASAQQYVVSTVVGNGSAGFSGDSGPATSAQLNLPGAIAVDSAGNIYIADGGNHRIRKVSSGVITTIAGTGTAGYAGDNGAATSAQLNDPVGVAVDGSGNVYIADAGNQVVRKISNGTITTFAGNNSLGAGYFGDGGAATSAQLNNPVGVTVDAAGNVYIADSNNNAIREVSGGNIQTFTGGTLHHPDSVAVDRSGNLYVADTGGRRVVFLSGGNATLFAGNGNYGFSGDNGLAVNAALNDPVGVAVDSAGYVYIADTINSRIRKVSPNGIITTIAGTGRPGYSGDGGPATSAMLYFPQGITLDSAGNVYFSDAGSSTIRMLRVVAPVISSNAVVNAASFGPQVSPGALATVFASNITGVQASANAPLTTSLAGVSVRIGNTNAPILFVSPKQVNFQVPWEASVGTATLTITSNGVTSNSIPVTIATAAPGLFSYGSGRAVVQNSDFTLNTSANPAKVGSTIMAYLTGSGPVSPAVADGALSPSAPLSKITSAYSATIGSTPAEVQFAGLAPGFAGLVQMNIVIPSGLAKGDYLLKVTIGGQESNSALISVTP